MPAKRNAPRLESALGLLGAAILAACSPSGSTETPSPISKPDSATAESRQADCAAGSVFGSVSLDGGQYVKGADRTYPEEAPARSVSVSSFSIDATEVTNDQFAKFVSDTGYVTIAERSPDPAMIPDGAPDFYYQAGAAVFKQPDGPDLNWWIYTPGANWRHPDGPDSSIDGKGSHPVVQIGYEDAVAYAEWAGRRLPTEIEWEYAARGGLDAATYEWGEDAPDGKSKRANTWQGIFPVANTAADGYVGTAPVGCYPPNGFGLYDMTGNVWEWTTSRFAGGESPAGEPVHVIKGGSYLCAANYCVRYRPAARQGQEVGLPTNHIGFRTVQNVTKSE